MADDALSFHYYVSSEASDWLYRFIDGRRTGYWSGNSGWMPYSRPISAGQHRLQWIYQKDASGSEHDDCARIDNIQLPFALWTRPSGTPEADTTLSIPNTPSPFASVAFTLHPNPTSEAVTISLPSSANTQTLLIYDIYGRLIDKIKIQPNFTTTQYFTTHLRLGTYTLVLHTGTGTYTQKMTVIR